MPFVAVNHEAIDISRSTMRNGEVLCLAVLFAPPNLLKPEQRFSF
jgi:hypothetical protein